MTKTKRNHFGATHDQHDHECLQWSLNRQIKTITFEASVLRFLLRLEGNLL
jgi:hypothetical protein